MGRGVVTLGEVATKAGRANRFPNTVFYFAPEGAFFLVDRSNSAIEENTGVQSTSKNRQ